VLLGLKLFHRAACFRVRINGLLDILLIHAPQSTVRDIVRLIARMVWATKVWSALIMPFL
jgi:hypothetical protein